VCRHCGNGLDAVSSPMRRVDRPEQEAPLELAPPRKTSVWPLVITVLVVGLGLLGWGLFSAVQPNPCRGRYSSVLFSYCTEVPEGWAAAPELASGGHIDRYLLLNAETNEGETGIPAIEQAAPAETTVEVAQLVNPAVVTQDYAQQFRTSQEADGLDLGQIEGVMLDGEQAVAWDFSVQEDRPEDTLHVRDVIIVRGDGAWQIRFVSTPEAYQEARLGFEEMLAAWRWQS
jgi:hypothetical protein